ncbi:MAG: bifunctional oligoribonuclease/PAP phosphatase NrnA [Rickettsiales bacterium]|jgi:phosphoesterase RecJ-like protein|nr:bifunctional oligoribonuclease/PAP phosphatase NrnA [Rickettsiales bacterium]
MKLKAEQFNLLLHRIKTAKNIGIFMHNNPDGDAVGSAGALAEILQDNFSKPTTLLYSGNMPDFLKFLPHVHNAIDSKNFKQKKSFDLTIAVDTANIQRISKESAAIYLSSRDTVKIDHHKNSLNFADLNIVDLLPSAAEIVYNIARQGKWKINPVAATALYAGIYSDTVGFQYLDDSKTFKIAAELVKLGANPRDIAEKLLTAKRDSTLINAKAVADAQFFFNGELAITYMTKEQCAYLDGKGTEAMGMLLTIEGIKYIALLKESASDVYVSLRGKCPVLSIANRLMGNGHSMAAAATVPGNIDTTREVVLQAFEKELKRKR